MRQVRRRNDLHGLQLKFSIYVFEDVIYRA